MQKLRVLDMTELSPVQRSWLLACVFFVLWPASGQQSEAWGVLGQSRALDFGFLSKPKHHRTHAGSTEMLKLVSHHQLEVAFNSLPMDFRTYLHSAVRVIALRSGTLGVWLPALLELGFKTWGMSPSVLLVSF